MAQWIKQSTSITEKIGPFLDDTDGFTPETALTITQPDIRLSKNGGAFAQKAAAQSLTHDEKGFYGLTLDATDTDTLGRLKGNVDKTGALPVFFDFMVVPANVWESMFGSDKLQIDLAEWLGTAAATPSVAGVPEVDITHVAGAVLNALVSGRMDSSVGAMAAAVVTATAMATDAITAAKIAASAIGSSEAPNLDAAVSSRATPAQVLTQVNAALDTAIAELAVAIPTATPSVRTGIMLGYMLLRNQLKTQTSAVDALEVYNDAGTLITKKLITDDGSDYVEAKMS